MCLAAVVGLGHDFYDPAVDLIKTEINEFYSDHYSPQILWLYFINDKVGLFKIYFLCGHIISLISGIGFNDQYVSEFCQPSIAGS